MGKPAFTIKIDGAAKDTVGVKGEYRVFFKYQKEWEIDDWPDTVCTIEVSWRVPSVGKAHVHWKDQFCKDTGRKIALSRALGNIFFSKEQKKLFWKAYFKLTNNQKVLSYIK